MNPLRRDLDRAVRDMFRAGVARPLVTLGFKGHNGGLRRARPGHVDFVRMRRSQFPDPDEVCVTLVCGVYVEGFWDLFDPMVARWGPMLEHCPAQETIGFMAPDARMTNWSLRHATRAEDAARIEAEWATRVARDMVPWFERFATKENIAQVMHDMPRGLFGSVACGSLLGCRTRAGYLYLLCGDLAAARRCADTAEAALANGRNPDYFRPKLARLRDLIAAAERGEKLPLPLPMPPVPTRAKRKPAARRGKP